MTRSISHLFFRSILSSASACGIVRGKPSNTKPFEQSDFLSRSSMMPIMISSGTSLPALIRGWAFRPSSVPCWTAARRMSPVEIWGIPNSANSFFACVPFPAPGGPSKAMFIPFPAQHALGRDAQPPADSGASRAGESLVVAADQVAFDLLNRVERDTDHDQDGRSAKWEVDADHVGEHRRNHANRRQVDATAEG